ncbi:MAG TPA: hypothetical protein VNT01_10100 [Symbiobacteriaceae bacterium]|nr:hypothetical protein [Symbiobacteriaceae bacterium]
MIRLSTVIACSTVELAYLAALVSDGPLIGAPDPFYGWIALEIEAALMQARATLARRGLILIAPDGTVEAAPEVGSIIRACTESAVSFRLVRTLPEAGTSLHHFHWTPDLCVEIGMTPDGEQVDLIVLDALPERISDLFHLEEQPEPAATGGEVPEALLERARDLAEEARTEEAAVLLYQGGLSLETAELLAADLAAPHLNGAFIALVGGESGWQADGVVLLEGDSGLWLLKPGQGRMAISPGGAACARLEIDRLLGK